MVGREDEGRIHPPTVYLETLEPIGGWKGNEEAIKLLNCPGVCFVDANIEHHLPLGYTI